MSRPRLLLLDEPSMGLSPMMTEEIGRIVQEVRSKGVSGGFGGTKRRTCLSLADYGYVLETGSVTLEGEAAMLRGSAHVRKAYLGG